MHKILVALLSLSIAAGCTTTRSYQSIDASSTKQVQPGKTVLIEFVDGSSEKVEIRSYGQTSVEVFSADDTVSSIDYADILTMQARELDGFRTTGAVVSGLLLFGLVNTLENMAFFPAGP